MHKQKESCGNALKGYNININIRHRPLKRAFDIIFSLVLLFFLLPLMLIIALIVKLTSHGPMFFSHNRVGRGGRLFKCYKFRTMYEDAEERQSQLIASCETLRDEWKYQRKFKRDPRITFIGKFLRKTSLDELPQFWNVLKGDLSVVGPRPVVVEEVVEYFGKKAEKILSIRPGITGLWQVSGRSDLCYTKRMQYDEQYVDENSMILDLKLIFKTLPVVIFSQGAY